MFSSQSNKKYFYIGPMFRRDRPQKGRLRQFHQIGAEAFGFEEALIDIEAISMLIDFLYKIGIYDFILNINSLGQIDEKAVFIKELSKYLAGKVNQLCNNCFHRIKINILRVLDCKIGSCRELLKNAPMMFNFLNLESKNHFETLKAGLQSLNIKFIISQNLVRGLDYYTRTVFEITTNKLGAKNVIAAGGRYDNLVKNLGGKNIPAFGFSIGIERMLLSLTKKIVIGNKVNLDIVLIYADKYGRDFVFLFAQKLRIIGLKVVTVLQFKSIKSQMRYANKIQARSVLVIGKKELLCKQGELKMLFNKVRIKVKLHPQEIADRLIE